MPIYEYLNKETGEIFEEIRSIADRDKPYIDPDGVECPRIFPSSVSGWLKGREVFQVDPEFVKKCNPKYVKYQDGHKEKYDPTRHF